MSSKARIDKLESRMNSAERCAECGRRLDGGYDELIEFTMLTNGEDFPPNPPCPECGQRSIQFTLDISSPEVKERIRRANQNAKAS